MSLSQNLRVMLAVTELGQKEKQGTGLLGIFFLYHVFISMVFQQQPLKMTFSTFREGSVRGKLEEL